MRALVTGATGFLGAATVARLRADGVAVRALVRPGRASAAATADEICEGDLRDDAALERAVTGVDWVIHCGAHVSTSGPWEEFESANVRATETLIRLAVAAGVQRFVHVSSLSVFAVPTDGATVTEDGAYEEAADERGSYARSKLAADRVAQAAIASGAPVTVVRPGLLYGPGRTPPLARRAIAVGPFRVMLASRGYLLPLAYVDNVADALVLAARTPAARGRTYTIVDLHARQAEYTALYRAASGATWRPVYVPLLLVRTAVRGAEVLARATGRRSPITRHQVERTLRSATFMTRRAQDELGWVPRVSVGEALRRSFAAGRAAEGQGAAAAGARSPA